MSSTRCAQRCGCSLGGVDRYQIAFICLPVYACQSSNAAPLRQSRLSVENDRSPAGRTAAAAHMGRCLTRSALGRGALLATRPGEFCPDLGKLFFHVLCWSFTLVILVWAQYEIGAAAVEDLRVEPLRHGAADSSVCDHEPAPRFGVITDKQEYGLILRGVPVAFEHNNPKPGCRAWVAGIFGREVVKLRMGSVDEGLQPAIAVGMPGCRF